MRTVSMLALALSVLPALSSSQVCKRQVDNRYISIEIQACDSISGFAFEWITLFAADTARCFNVSKIERHAPYVVKLGPGQASIAVNGKSGRGKLFFKYKTTDEEKQSMQYIAAGEKVMISWAPFGAMGTGTTWTSHKRHGGPTADELTVWASMNQ